MANGTPKQTNSNIKDSDANHDFAVSDQAKTILVSNIKLEVAERARKLRTQSTLHAQGLRSRLGMRVNRIPRSLKTANVLDLLDRYTDPPQKPTNPLSSRVGVHGDTQTIQEKSTSASGDESASMPEAKLVTASKSKPTATGKAKNPTGSKAKPPSAPKTRTVTAPKAKTIPAPKGKTAAPTVRTRGLKRSSNELSSDNKENVHLDVPKKRTKTAAAAAISTASSRAKRAPVAKPIAPTPVPVASGRTLRARH
ncbi:hypothetical protein EJ05DRAFT_541334 [Pseudovirgaria hyperparasitica]|uniref:Borealin N-terminal domain-containing protein n=1 Tax=Pseudovirgaria hyperparasitica TaxID=470096 RepID=A0A6A6VWZ6_9PEZI|nr:uncharacterized protein EJ05DRAFT_541334 [Pseudovirgaria hyperparasitica]KAF2754234.1 hypothetical protein EJ05DRAFT_541334 [Pseudovirgaria hyperparasitica]